MSGNENKYNSHREEIMKRIGTDFYNLCSKYFNSLVGWSLRMESPEDCAKYDPEIIAFEQSEGQSVAFKNPLGDDCSVSKRDLHEQCLIFDITIKSRQDFDPPLTIETFVIDNLGNIVLARVAESDRNGGFSHRTAEIHPEELLAKINTTYIAA